jgi:2'-5' RNA ligase
MNYFLGIVPPDEYKEQVADFQNRWPGNRIGEVAEPHITVKAQGGLHRDLVWIDQIKNACSRAFSCRLLNRLRSAALSFT